MTQNTTFEVQVLQDGQWTIHENFLGHQRDEAIAEAKKQLEGIKAIEAVKVVKEILDPDTGVFNDTVIFREAGKPKPKVRGRGKAIDRSRTFKQTGKGSRKGSNKGTSSLGSVILKLLMVVLFSVCLAGLVSVIVSEILGGETLFGIRFVGTTEANLLIGTFILVFLISIVVLSLITMRGVKLKAAKTPRFVIWLVGWWALATQKRAENQAARQAAASRARAAAPAPSAETLSQAEQQPEEPEPEPETEPEAAEQDQALSETAEKLKDYMINFLTKGMEGSQTDINKMDNFNKFGLSLYMAGACEILSQKGNMDLLSRSKILADGVQVMGFKKSHAASFAEKYEEYLMADPRYMQMFQSGRNAINTYLADETIAPKFLDNAMSEWNKPKKKEQTGPVTVLFTDIVGSTAMTQALGDAGAQNVVRAHNRVVREALSANAGSEVKHTGDGIMASFNRTSDGVDAAIQIQRETAQHNLNNPELPLHLKIGLNAGEPIAEDNDLFGTVVQLAARIVDTASADQIYISEIVRGLCAGKNYQIADRGGFEMKGFASAVNIFEVVWNNGEGEPRDFVPGQAATAETAPAEGAAPATPSATKAAPVAPAAPEVAPATPAATEAAPATPSATESAPAAPAAPEAAPATPAATESAPAAPAAPEAAPSTEPAPAEPAPEDTEDNTPSSD